MTHTPTPYNAEYAEDSDALLISAAPNAKGWGAEICTVADEGTAAFIVKACNSHAKLVEALAKIASEKVMVNERGSDLADYLIADIDHLQRIAMKALQQIKENDND